jgi:biofilm PGA synthesis N-glycosyltransferase PgaC
MTVWKFIFFASCFVVFYNYLGYALIVYFLNKLKRKKSTTGQDDFFPTVSFIVAAFNEEDCIEEKILNSLQQDYPLGKMEFIFITDGSTDRTASIISAFPTIKLLHKDERRGKSAALNRAVNAAVNDILIFSDANTVLNPEAVKNIARHYKDPKVGGVAGEKKIIGSGQVGASEGMYWKYESFLKKIDSEFYSVVGAAGELFSVRRKLFEPVSHDVILDDFVISLKVASKGLVIVYEPDAFAMELPSFSMKDEKKRKTRISAGGFQAIGMLGSLFRFWRHPRLSFLYISHRVLRWALTPFCLVTALLSNLIIFSGTNSGLYAVLFLLQVLFYVAAFMGSQVQSKKGIFKLFKLAWYFVFMNISVLQGFARFLKGKQPAAWEKAKRQTVSN